MQKIKIQSISDIITNSSSEVFCRIESDDYLNEIYELLSPLFPSDDPEIYPAISEVIPSEEWYGKEEELKNLPDKWLEIELPYGMSESYKFYKAGLEAILDSKFKNKYKIVRYEY